MRNFGSLCTLSRFLKRKKLLWVVLVITSAILYFLFDLFAFLFIHSPSLNQLPSGPLEDVCESFFSNLNHYQGGQWVTDFTTWENSDIITSVQRMRLYSHCYLRNKFVPRSFDLSEIEEKLFPIFNSTELSCKSSRNCKTSSMFSDYGKGRGIALSIGVMQLDDFHRLLYTLAHLKNTLPIEVVHKGELGSKRMAAAMDIASNTNPPQKLAFKNVENYIDPQHYAKFSRFTNKWLPALFSSFEEVIIMDADVVPIVPPEELFDLEGYRLTGSYLFRDRAISTEFLPSEEINLYRKLLPSKQEISKFDLPLPPPGRSRLELLTGHHHTVESGIVIMDRRDFLPGLLMGLALQLWKPTSHALWGDKELFWLGQSIAGEENYFVHRLSAGSIGQLKTLDNKFITDPKERETVENSMVCSIQVAHFSEQHELLWLNSGLLNCKFGSWTADFTKYYKDEYASKEALQKYYLQTVDVNAAIIAPYIKKPMFNWWKRLIIGFQRYDELGCSGYVWCAYDNPSAGYPGQKILLSDQLIERFNGIKRAWMGIS